MSNVKTREKIVASCALCGDVTEMTGEHIIAAWIGRLAGSDIPGTIFYYDYKGEREVTRIDNSEKGGHKNLTAPVLCSPCNSEWSNRIQEETRKFLKPFLEGKQRYLSMVEREQFAIWMSLFVIVRQLFHPKLTAIHSAQRLAFRNSLTNVRPNRKFRERQITRNGSPLPAIKVWIAPFFGTENNFATYYSGFRVGDSHEIDDQEADLNAYISLAAFGNTLVFAMGGEVEPITNLCSQSNIYISQILRGMGLKQVWPNHSAYLCNTPDKVLNDQDFELIPGLIFNALKLTAKVDESFEIIPIYGEPNTSSFHPRYG